MGYHQSENEPPETSCRFQRGHHFLRNRLSITIHDPDHSANEDRYITIGASITGRLLMVAHTDRGDRTRIISARELT